MAPSRVNFCPEVFTKEVETGCEALVVELDGAVVGLVEGADVEGAEVGWVVTDPGRH